jgi:hypothetical protein
LAQGSELTEHDPAWADKKLLYEDNDFEKNNIDVHDQTVSALNMLRSEGQRHRQAEKYM